MVSRVYSYTRFSDPRQSKGHSVRRQADYAMEYAQKNGLMLDDSLTLKDEGLSAYHQNHISKGALGTFYRAIEDGMIEPGSVLIVENMDRLSRATPLNALPYFLDIINAGISVVIASDGKLYSQESIEQNPYQLIESLSEMVRANMESKHKSERVKASIVGQIKYWLEHGHGKIIVNGQNPYWVKPKKDKTGFYLIEERANIIREIIRLCIKGWGVMKIQRHLKENYQPFKGKKWYAVYLTSVLHNRVLVGERSFVVNDKKYIIKNYYPALISETEFTVIQNELKNRASTKSQQSIPSIVTGNKISFCGHCGCRLTAQNHKPRSYNGKVYPVTDGLRRIRCNSRMDGIDCQYTAVNSVSIAVSISAMPVERALLEYCADKMELSAILNDDTDKTLSIKAKIGELQRQASEAEIVVNNGKTAMTRLLLEGDDVSAINNLVKQHQTQHDDLIAQIQTLEDQVRLQKVHKSSDLIDQWQKIKDDIYNMNEESRLLIRQIVKKTFKRMDIYFHSFSKSRLGLLTKLPFDDNDIVMVLTFHNDKTRILSINRKTGSWVKGGDITINAESVLSALADHQ